MAPMTVCEPAPVYPMRYTAPTNNNSSDLDGLSDAEYFKKAFEDIENTRIANGPDATTLPCFKCKLDQPLLRLNGSWDWTSILGLYCCCLACPALWLDHVVPSTWHNKAFYCSTCGTHLADYNGSEEVMKYTDPKKKTLNNARRVGLMPKSNYKEEPIFLRRNNMRCVTSFYKDSKVTVFNSSHAYCAKNRIKNLDLSLPWSNYAEVAAEYLFEIINCLRQDKEVVTNIEVGQWWKYTTEGQYLGGRAMASGQYGHALDAISSIKTDDPDWELDPEMIWSRLFRSILFQVYGEMRIETTDCFYTKVRTQRMLDRLNLTSEDDDRRCAAIELALSYIQFIDTSCQSASTMALNRLQPIMERWWVDVLASGKATPAKIQTPTPAAVAKFAGPLAAEAKIWHHRASPIRSITYFLSESGLPRHVHAAQTVAMTFGSQTMPDGFGSEDPWRMGQEWRK